MTIIIKTITFVFVTLIWVILGLYVAIPAIAVASLLLPLGILSNIFGGSGANAMNELLEKSISIYPSGFRRIYKAAYKPSSGGGSVSGFWKGLFGGILTIVGATIFWVFFFAALEYFCMEFSSRTLQEFI